VARVRRWTTPDVRARFAGRRARRLLLPLGALALVAVAVGLIVSAEVPGTSRGANSPSPSSGAATVERRDLVQTDTESGTLGYASPATVYNRVSGTITWLPSVGQEVKPGGTLYKVDNSPVVLFDGTTPAFRDLSAAVSDGPDVAELNRNLVNLGFADGEIALDDTWQPGTTDAVERWQASLGETETGVITLGQVIFLPGPQLITTVDTVLGSTGGAGGSGASGSGASGSGSGSSTGASLEGSAPRPEFVSLTTTTTTPASGTTGPTGPTGPQGPTSSPNGRGPGGGGASSSSTLQLKALIALLQAEIAELKSEKRSASTLSASPARAGSAASTSGARGGGGGGASSSAGGGSASGSGAGGSSAAGGASGAGSQAEPIMQTTSTQEVVTVQLDATKQSEAVVGEAVTVQLPDGSTTDGKITQVSPVAQSSSSSSGSGAGGAAAGGSSSSPSATIPVTITLTGHTRLSGLDQAAVSVNFAQQRATGVLSVPVTALIATQGGNYAVQTATTPHRLIPVTPGLFAAGYVQISGQGIYPGLQVTDSQG
jgi:Putative peptidoglycan binding domain